MTIFLRCLLLPDAQLLSIGSTEENNFVSKYINEDPLITNRVWLGMDINAQGNLKQLQESKTIQAFFNLPCLPQILMSLMVHAKWNASQILEIFFF